MKSTKRMRRILAFVLISVMMLCKNSFVYAANVADFVNDSGIIDEIESVDEADDSESEIVNEDNTLEAQVSVGYIFEVPTELGKDVFVQLGTSEDIFSEIKITIERDGEMLDCESDAIIENVVAFHLEFDDRLKSIFGIVNQNTFIADLSVLDQSQGEKIVVEETEIISEEIIEEDLQNIEIESYIAENVEEDENAISEAMSAANPISTFSLSQSRSKSEYIVVIDPGHSIQKAGTERTWDGVTYYEHELVMKIARYLVEELEQYSGVTVHLTRDENTHKEIEERVKYAQSVNADMLVSIHLNATNEDTTKASGVTAMVAKIGSYNKENAVAGQEIARSILDELVALGFKDRDFTILFSKDNTYPDGSRADYYGIVRFGQQYDVPSMIIEHGFLNNESDFRRYLSTETGLKRLGVADATGIANYLGISKEDDSGLSGWQTIDKKIYYYQDGKPLTGTPVINGKKYWFDGNGVRQTGWLYLLNWKMYFDSATGEAKTGMADIDGKRYLFNNDGVMQNYAGTTVIDGKKYWFSTDNASLKTGWLNLGDWKLYFDSEDYAAKVGMADINGKRYLFNSDGVMQTYAGTPVINGKKYWFSTEGGSLKTGWLNLGDWKLYFDPEDYEAKVGMADINGKRYLFNPDGVMQTYAGTTVIDGKKYWFSTDDAALKTGWLHLGDWTMYFKPKTYEAAVGWETIDGKQYYFDNNGILAEGFVTKGSYSYYLKSDGTYAIGTPVINGEKYGFDSQGRQIFGWYVLGSWKFYFDPDNGGAAVTTYKKLDDVTYYFNNDGTLASSSNSFYIKLKDPANGKTYTLESQFDTDPVVDDEVLLTALTYTESGNQELACQVATALVILNRLESKSYPDTLRYVVYQKSQFEVARSGALTKLLNAYKNDDQSQLKWLKTTEEAVAIALETIGAYKTDGLDRTIEGVTFPNKKTDFDYLGFMTPSAFERLNLDPVAAEAFQIDDVMFFTKWITK